MREKQVFLSRLLARLAHEIGNPLSSLDIHVQLLQEDLAQAPPEIRQRTAGRLEIIHGEVRRLESIVQQFLRLTGPSEIDLQTVEAGPLLAHVCQILGPEAAARAIELATVVPPDLPTFAADPAQLTQALINLVLNAIQAIERGGRVEVRARTDDDNAMLVLTVADTGPGIAAEKRSTIFEPFFTTRTDGSGLGLWIVQQIVLAHGGFIDVTEATAGGALFSLHFPLHREPNTDGNLPH